MALCPRCIKEEKETTMEIQGTHLVCPVCTFSRDFPKRMPTLAETLKIIAQKDQEIAELKSYIRKLERR